MTENKNFDFADVLTNISSFLCVMEDYNDSNILESDVLLALNMLRASIEDSIKNSNKNDSTTKEKIEQKAT
jgi:CTP:phosphocholine cytidylyltransferase-like protein